MTTVKKIGKAVLIAIGVIAALFVIVYVLLCGRGGKYYNEDGSYKKIDAGSSISYIMGHPALEGLGENVLPLSGDLVRTVTKPWKLKIMIPFLGKHEPTVVDGINYTIDMAGEGRTQFLSYYSDADKTADPAKEETGLFMYKGEEGAPFAVVVPGGSFTMLGVVSSAFPYAEPLMDAGYNVFVLKYRVGAYEGEEDKFPASDRAAEDMTAAVQYILENAEALGVGSEYVVIGSSAGGQVTARYCAEGEYDALGFNAPAACIMLYPANCERYDYDGCTVPMYITVCEDDPKINVAGLDSAVEKMKAAGLTVSYNRFETGGHSFGIGVGTPAEGWMEKSIAFAAEYLN
ncbi:MAG: alpha/beta hydrolase [Clostridia bacterium]|nr:alpha/beta hydrolase [Clostridia bacterium]